MLELAIVAVLSAAAGVACALAVSAFPSADPARSASRQLGAEAAQRRTIRRFLSARLDPATATGLALTLALGGVLIVFIVMGVTIAMIRSSSGVVGLDAAVTRWAAAHTSGLSRAVFGFITLAGSTIGVVAVALATAVFALRTGRGRRVPLFLLLALAAHLVLANLIKVAVERVRPDAPPFDVLSGPSFPSGHATAAAAVWAAAALVLGLGASPRVRAALAGAAAGIAVAVACTRVFLGAHWTSDVIGGLLLGWTWFALCAVAFGGRELRFGAPAREAADTSAPQAPADGER